MPDLFSRGSIIHNGASNLLAGLHVLDAEAVAERNICLRRTRAPWAFTTWVVVSSVKGAPMGFFPETEMPIVSNGRWLRRTLPVLRGLG